MSDATPTPQAYHGPGLCIARVFRYRGQFYITQAIRESSSEQFSVVATARHTTPTPEVLVEWNAAPATQELLLGTPVIYEGNRLTIAIIDLSIVVVPELPPGGVRSELNVTAVDEAGWVFRRDLFGAHSLQVRFLRRELEDRASEEE